MIRKAFAAVMISAVFFLFACTPEPEQIGFSAMDTYMTFKLYGENAAETAEKLKTETKWLDGLLSTTKKDSDIYRINTDKSKVRVSDATLDIIGRSLSYCKKTDGALDISVYPIVEEWGFISGRYTIPDSKRLADLLKSVDYKKILLSISDNTISIPNNFKIDLGATAKGYAADILGDILKENNISSAILNLGGTVSAIGKKPDGNSWRVGIANPENSSDYIGYISLSDKIIATSGSYERYFTGSDGKIYSHIINPKTGYPADSELVSVSVISGSGIMCDALSTALFVMGREEAENYWKSSKDFDLIMLTADNTVYISEGAFDFFTLADGFKDFELIKIE